MLPFILMTLDPFRSARMKLDRADAHYQTLERAMEIWLERLASKGKKLVTLRQDYWPRGHCIIVNVVRVEASDPRWGILVGDVLHNLNSALDHIAFAAVELGRSPPHTLTGNERERIKFPLIKQRPNRKKPFATMVKNLLPGIGVRHRALIRRHQPFMVPKRMRRMHTLSLMRRYANYDKHRIVQPIYYRSYETIFDVVDQRDFIVNRIAPPKRPVPMEPGAEILRVYGRRDGPNPQVEMNVSGSPEPALEGGIWLGDLLQVPAVIMNTLIDDLETSP